jgi:tRNA (guanine10-N2)-methyltransferase
LTSKSAVQFDAHAAEELVYQPLRYFFGRVVAEGPGIVNDFALSTRPFVGTTAMNALCAHLSANAAQVLPGQCVLDPFCGTGSLLVAAAYLGGSPCSVVRVMIMQSIAPDFVF